VSAIGKQMLPFGFRSVVFDRFDDVTFRTRAAVAGRNVQRQGAYRHNRKRLYKRLREMPTLFPSVTHLKSDYTVIYTLQLHGIRITGVIFLLTDAIRTWRGCTTRNNDSPIRN
jgi:hypothetical protein